MTQASDTPPNGRNGNSRQRRLASRMARTVRYRLFVPLKRSRHPPEYAARGVMVGLAWAMTPFIGVQMGMSFLTWVVCRYVFRWHFNLLIACAWTWVTNVFTALPVYYLFYVTGALMLGHWDDLTGYHAFAGLWHAALDDNADDFVHGWFGADSSILSVLESYLALFVRNLGLSMLVGSLPYAVLCGWLGYVWSLRFTVAYRRARRERMLRQAARGG